MPRIAVADARIVPPRRGRSGEREPRAGVQEEGRAQEGRAARRGHRHLLQVHAGYIYIYIYV